MSTTTVSDGRLVTYLDNALDADRRNEIHAVLEQDESLAARLGAPDFEKAAVFSSLDAVADAAPLEFLRSQIHDQAAKPRFSFVAGSQWQKIAATLPVGVGIGWGCRPAQWAGSEQRLAYSSSRLSKALDNFDPLTDRQ